ncbi:hypothetical protein D3C81_333600 [compost metagenome]
MIIVNYTPKGKAISDFESTEFAKSLKDNPNKTVDVSTENVILAVRVLIKEGFYSINEIKIFRDEVYCEVTPNGRFIAEWPGTAWDDYLDKLVNLN